MQRFVTAALAGLVLAVGARADGPYAPLPKAVSSFGAAVADGFVYVYGGHCGKTHAYSTDDMLGTFHRLNLADPAKWEELPGGPAAQGLALVAHGGKVYRLGGMQARNKPGEPADTNSLASAARFDPKMKTWENLPDLPEPRSSHDAAVVGDRIFVAGGWQMTGKDGTPKWLDTMAVLDLSKSPLTWESVPQPFKRRALAAVGFDGRLFVVAGMGPDGAETVVNVFDPVKKAWTVGPTLSGGSTAGFNPAACVCEGKLYVSPADGRLLRLSAKGDAWEEVGQLKQPRVVHRLVPIGPGKMLALGGASKTGNVALSEEVVPMK